MAETGYITLLLALIASCYSAVFNIIGSGKNHRALLTSARFGLFATGGLVTVAVGVLFCALMIHDFSIEYVTYYSGRDTSLPYLISALWAGNDGSLLFWTWLLTIFASIFALRHRDADNRLMPYASSVTMFTGAFLLLLMLLAANPFLEISVVPPDGIGLNPLLENPGMVIHPPLLLAAYAGFTVPFALAVAALMTGKLSGEWTVPARKWTIFAWLLLGIGNIVGAWWAYVELGWGGYWNWDPVENAGLMPWLVSTAFLHSLIMQRRKGMLKVWNMVLIILTFNLVIFGTFITRTGFLSSVHTYSESKMGVFFFIFLGLSLLGSLGLLFFRRKRLTDESRAENFISREFTFQLNSIFLVAAAVIILIGTVFPLVSEVTRGVQITMGADAFNRVNGPIFLAVLLLTGICTLISWRRVRVSGIIGALFWPLAVALIVDVILIFLGVGDFYALLGLGVCVFVLASIVSQWLREVGEYRRKRAENYLRAFHRLFAGNRARYGGYIVHFAIIVIAVGVIGSSFFSVEKEAYLEPGESIAIDNYVLIYDNMENYETPGKIVLSAVVSVYHNDEYIGRLTPEKYFQRNYKQPVTEVAIRSTLVEDLYVILAGWDEEGAAFKVLINPLVIWIWIGGGIMLLGGVVLFWPVGGKSLSAGDSVISNRAGTENETVMESLE